MEGQLPPPFSDDPQHGPAVRPLPPILRATKPGTWAHDTVSRRLREEILTRVFRENTFFAPDIIERLRELDEELAGAEHITLRFLRALPSGSAEPPDLRVWNDHILPQFISCTWLNAPWCVSEFYFYRRIMEAMEFFESRWDPFRIQKRLAVTTSMDTFAAYAVQVYSLFNEPETLEPEEVEEVFKMFLRISLGGNQMDLSLWPVGSGSMTAARVAPYALMDEEERAKAGAVAVTGAGAGPDSEGLGGIDDDDDEDLDEDDEETGATDSNNERAMRLLVDESDAVWQYIAARKPLAHVGMIVDNAGFELFSDLLLADTLITFGLARQVTLHLKGHPTFVSDAIEADVLWLLERMALGSGSVCDELATLAGRWLQHLGEGRWVTREDLYWAQPFPFWEMPPGIRSSIASQDLVFVKGDANYRRLLGDRDWPLDTPFADVVAYWPRGLCALRALKAELGCGLRARDIQRCQAMDPKWMVNGQWAVVQFFVGAQQQPPSPPLGAMPAAAEPVQTARRPSPPSDVPDDIDL